MKLLLILLLTLTVFFFVRNYDFKTIKIYTESFSTGLSGHVMPEFFQPSEADIKTDVTTI